MKLIKKYICFFGVLFFVACGHIGQNTGSEGKEVLGGRIYGGTLRVNEVDKYVSLYPYLISDEVSKNIAAQIYEGLVRFDPKNVTHVLPAIARSWEVDPSGLVYTFKLGKGILFQDNACFPKGKGRELTAYDVKYSFEQLCTSGKNNELFQSTFKGIVDGAEEYYNAGTNAKTADLKGVKVMDKYTVQIRLIKPIRSFLYILAGPAGYIIPHEAIEKYGTSATVGSGPFIFDNPTNNDSVLLIRNPTFHRIDSLGNKLPFLDSIRISFISNKSKELDEFKKGDIHLIFGLPSSSISEMVEAQITDFNGKNPKYYLQRNSEYATHYYQFNITKKPFNDVKVRQAFSYAIDRTKIVTEVLKSEAFGPGICGITPPSISGYDITQIKGYNFNPEKAKSLLAEAGYPNGKGFPTVNIEVSSGGGKYLNVVEEVKKQLKDELNVNVDYTVVPLKQSIEDAKYLRADMFRFAWIADYPSPGNFLRILYGANVPDNRSEPSFPNTSRYKNPVFDSLYEAGVAARKQTDGYADFMKAEQLMMQDAPLLILWYGENLKMSHSFVKNFYFNPMNYKDFSEVYIKKSEMDKRE